MSDETLLIETPAALDALCERLRTHAWLAVDTEFMRERTYYPELCLLQVGVPGLAACVDTLAVPRLDPLMRILLDGQVVKVMHAARQDLEILFNLSGQVPAPVFDTQIAARFLGLPDQAGYGTVVQQFLGITLDKSQARTDWCRRPLPEAALSYAADDVRHLCTLYTLLQAELDKRQRRAWPEPEFQALVDEKLYRPDPDNAWKRLRGIQRLKPKALALLKPLAAWRERTAMDENRPRQWILKDETLLDLVRQHPGDLAALSALRGVGENLVRKHGETLLKILREGGTPVTPPKTGGPLSAEQDALVDSLMAVVRLRAADAEISAASLTNRSDLEKLVRGERDIALLKDWRLETAGRAVLEFLEGRTTLTADGGKLKLA